MTAPDDLARERVKADIALSEAANKIVSLRDDLISLRLLRTKINDALNDLAYIEGQKKGASS